MKRQLLRIRSRCHRDACFPGYSVSHTDTLGMRVSPHMFPISDTRFPRTHFTRDIRVSWIAVPQYSSVYSNLLQINLIMKLYLYCYVKTFTVTTLSIYARAHYVVLRRKSKEKSQKTLTVTNLKKAKLEIGLSLLKHSGN